MDSLLPHLPNLSRVRAANIAQLVFAVGRRFINNFGGLNNLPLGFA